ncbi:hypothetical protein F5Y03DRAFT_390373 [Xylaria venustula]|nr:hypothetical protein F5Y03DRAFT_390373 [Xylaria venustula]
MSHNYYYCLPPNADSGVISGVEVRWQKSSFTNKLDEQVARTDAPREILKALTEHVLVEFCKKTGNNKIKITAPPHRFTIDSKDGSKRGESMEHVSADLSGPYPGKSHVYIRAPGYDWYQMSAVGATIVLKNQTQVDPTLSWGEYPSLSGSFGALVNANTQTGYAGHHATQAGGSMQAYTSATIGSAPQGGGYQYCQKEWGHIRMMANVSYI